LFVALAIPVAVLIAAFAIMEDAANRSRSREEVLREGHMIARAVQIATTNALRDRQLADVHQLIDDISGHETILAIRLFDVAGRLNYAPHGARTAPLPSPEAIQRVIRNNQLAHDHYAIAGQPVIGWLAPLDDPQGRPLGAVEVVQRESFVEEDAAASSRAIALFAAILIAAVALTVFAITRFSVARPIQELVQGARGIGEGDWGALVPVRRRDELGRLAAEFNDMRERLALMHARLAAEQEERRSIESDLREAERLASLGRFAAGVAHEIGTPLNVISGRAESLIRRGVDETAERGLRIIADQIERISRIVRGVLDFARARELRIAPTDLGHTIGAVVELVAEPFEARGITIETVLHADLPLVAADPDQLQQVFLNLALNAAEAMPAGGHLRIVAVLGDRARPEPGAVPSRCVTVTFEDTGVGISPAHLGRVFEPFFTTKEVGGGTGLGLAISYGIVREHGGWLDVASAIDRGTSMTVCLPLEPLPSDAGWREIEEAV
jgi:signal transduction histidine kinase